MYTLTLNRANFVFWGFQNLCTVMNCLDAQFMYKYDWIQVLKSSLQLHSFVGNSLDENESLNINFPK